MQMSTTKRRRKRCSPCFLGKHQPVLGLLQHRSHFLRGSVWWVSIRQKSRCQREREGEKDVYLAFSECISQLFDSFIADIIPFEVECCECLWEKSADVNEKEKEKKMFTLLSRKALVSCLAPSSPILFPSRSSVVSVYERKVQMSTRERSRKRYSPCSLGKCQPIVWHLQRRYDWIWGWVWWVSMR